MGTVGVYDADFMNYEHVIPNLECAKLCTYFYNRHEIAVLSPELNPERFTKFYVRKEYDDGIYPKQLFLPNCSYSGRAFNPTHYSPLEPAIERTIPNMHIYDRYIDKYGPKRADTQQIKRILNCAHIRLAEDGVTPKSIIQLQRIMDANRYTGIIFHDYDLGKIPQAYDLIYELTQKRHFAGRMNEVNPYGVGNKFPIQVNSSDELDNWLKVCALPNLFFLQYNGFMSNKTLYRLCTENTQIARQVYYNVSSGCSSEDDFFVSRALQIFKQVLFLRRSGIKILLNYDEDLIITPELKTFIEAMNCWLSFAWGEGFVPAANSLYQFCRQHKQLQYRSWSFMSVKLSTDELRNMFQYVRINNYGLFKMFYEWDAVSYKEGEFLNDWSRDS